jgi:hypothetical protein
MDEKNLKNATVVCKVGCRYKSQLGRSSVPDPKLIISDPDPQIENQDFPIRIRILLWTSDGEKKFPILVHNMTQMGWNLKLFEFFKNCVRNQYEFFHFLVHFQNIFLSLVWKREGSRSGSGAGSGSWRPNNFGSGRIRIRNTGEKGHKCPLLTVNKRPKVQPTETQPTPAS